MSQHTIVTTLLATGRPLPGVPFRHDPLVCQQYGAACDYGPVGPRTTGQNGMALVDMPGSTVNHYFIANYGGVEQVVNGIKQFGGSYRYTVGIDF